MVNIRELKKQESESIAKASSSGANRVFIQTYICIYYYTNNTMCICIFINWYKNKIMRQLRRHLHKKNGTFECLLVPFRSSL